jgi:hypothetical protein
MRLLQTLLLLLLCSLLTCKLLMYVPSTMLLLQVL